MKLLFYMKNFYKIITHQLQVEFFTNNSIKSIIYYNKDRKLHKLDGPAIEYYYENGNIAKQEYYINGELHRENGPATIEYYDNGEIGREIYLQKNYYYRESGPNFITYHSNGNKDMESYLSPVGLRHNLEGPAWILYYNNEPIKEEYWILDKQYNDVFIWAIKATNMKDEGIKLWHY